MPDYAERLAEARARMGSLGIDLLYLTPGANAQYLTGWKRRPPTFGNIQRNGGWVEGMLIGVEAGPILCVPRMIKDFWLAESPGFRVEVLPDLGDPVDFLRRLLAEFKPRVIALENRAWAELVLGLKAAAPEAELRLASDVLAEMRMVKSAEEVETLRAAGAIVERAMADLLSWLRPGTGQTEVDTVLELDRLMVSHGGDGPSFTTAAWQLGPNGNASIAEKTARRRLEYGNALCFDFGAVHEEFCYDFGRAVFLGEPPPAFRRAYDLVIESQRVGIAALKAGNVCERVDAEARAVIADGGYGDYFTHRLGHGIGLDVHEAPFLDKGDRTVLREGMCFTVEPSIFIPGRFGARVEDVVVVGRDGGAPLTNFPRELQVIG
jgi:Xaa-Pro aminopeptidase